MAFDAELAVQTAVFAALNVADVTELAEVYQHVPEDSDAPLIVIGDVSLTPQGGKDGGFDRAELEIYSIRRVKTDEAGQPVEIVGLEALTPLKAAVRDKLEGKLLTFAGADLSPPVQESSDSELLEDGLTYLGTQRFSLTVQPAA